MSIETIQAVILNHSSQTIKKFSRNSSALQHYQDNEQGQLINDLHRKWLSIPEACIVAHHVATLNDGGEEVNFVVAVNSHYTSTQYELKKHKGKSLRFMFIFFESDEESARLYVYQTLRQTVMQNHPVQVDVKYHNVSFH